MAPTKRRSSASAAISKSAIEQVGSTLTNLPEKPKENLSLREAVSELHSAITTALSRGYSYDEVVGILAGQGVGITVASLKRYLAAARKDGTTKSKRTKRGTRSRTASLSQPTEVLSSAPAVDATLNGAATKTAEPEAPARKRRTKATTKPSTQSPAKSKTAAKAKPTPRAKTTSRSTSSRGRRRSNDTAS